MWVRLRGLLVTTPGRIALQLAVTVLLIVVLVRFGYVAEFAASVRSARWPWIAVAVPFGVLALQSHATRWWLLMRRAGSVPLPAATLILLVAGAIGDFVPFRAGAAFQVQVTHRRYGIARAAVAGTLALEMLLDVLVVAFLAVFIVPSAGLSLGWSRWSPFAFLGALAVLLVVLLSPRRIPRPGVPPPVRSAASRFRADLLRGFGALGSRRQTAAALLLTAANWLFAAAGYYFLARAFALDLSPTAFVAMQLAVNLIAKVSPSEGNIGTYEVAAQQTLMRFGAPSAAAAAFAIGAHLAAMLGTVLLGVASAWLLSLRRDDVFYMTTPAEP